LLCFHRNNGHAKVPHSYLTRTLPLLFLHKISSKRTGTFSNVAMFVILASITTFPYTNFLAFIQYISLPNSQKFSSDLRTRVYICTLDSLIAFFHLVNVNCLNTNDTLSYALLSRISSGLHTEWRYCRFSQTHSKSAIL
jgi:hypothetical protein